MDCHAHKTFTNVNKSSEHQIPFGKSERKYIAKIFGDEFAERT